MSIDEDDSDEEIEDKDLTSLYEWMNARQIFHAVTHHHRKINSLSNLQPTRVLAVPPGKQYVIDIFSNDL